MSAALFAIEAVDLQHWLLAENGVTSPMQLAGEANAQHRELSEIAHRLAQAGLREQNDRLAALGQVSPPANGLVTTSSATGAAGVANAAVASGGSAAPGVSGPAVGPSPHAPATERSQVDPPVFSFAFEGSVGLTLDDAPNVDPVGGMVAGAAAFGRLFLGYTEFFRSAFTFGGRVEGGGWRDRTAFAALFDIGYRFELGPRQTGVVLSGGWTPGHVDAEQRAWTTAIGYRLGIGFQIDQLEIALGWREVHRGPAFRIACCR